MFKEIFLFELKYRLKRPATWAYFGILFVLTFILALGGNTPASEKVFLNAPGTIGQMLLIFSLFGILLSSAIMGVPVYRDIEHGTQNYYFSYPISEKGYILGRFWGSMITLILVSLGTQLGLIIGFALGPYAGFEDADRFATLNLLHYIQPTLIFYWSNLFFAGCIFFALVSLTKKIMLAYAGGAILFIVYLVTQTLVQDIDSKELVSLLDPFALGAYNNATQYWTPVEQNAQMVPFEGMVLWNRLLWVGLGVAIFLFTLFRFDFQRFLSKKLKGRKKDEVDTVLSPSAALNPIPAVSKVFSGNLHWRQLFRLGWMEFKNILADNFFKAILIAAVLFLFFDGWFGSPIYGTPSLPMTYYMLEVKSFTYVILVFILIVFMTGEVLHRERSVKYDQIFGSLPLPNWVIYGSKFLGLVLVCFVLVNMILFSGMLNQIFKGYFNFELDKYFIDLYLIEFPKYIMYVMLAFFVHSLVTKKFMGHVFTITIWLVLFGLSSFADIDYNLFLYSYTPGYTVSDMNGFGHFGTSLFWFRLYWLAFGGILTLIGLIFWKRGTDSGRKSRWKTANGNLTKPVLATAGICALLWIGSGLYNYYNVSVWGEYSTLDEGLESRANYEKKLKKYEFIDQPKVVDVKVYADLVPEERSATIKGMFTLVNKTNAPIDSLHLDWGGQSNYRNEVEVFEIDGVRPELGMEYEDYGYKIYALPKPMAPNDTLSMQITLKGFYKGFPNEGTGSNIVHNGTFLNNGFFPSFGYNSGVELNGDKSRREHDLPEKKYQLPDQKDAWGLNNLLFNDDGDYITFEGTVSTAPDQIAIMPGYLQKEWEENGRKYYTYKMEGELDYFYNISSARYDVHREEWKGKNGDKVNIEIFHHPGHKYNIDRFVHGVQKSLDYFTENYGPYQYRQMRIIEFPRYSTFAQSFPNTVPYAESFGWVGDFSDPNDLDYVFTVTSHEVAHQWWGHQITPSATRGSNQISETMAEYSSLMVMKKEYGVDAMQRFLKEEVDRYLSGRANESKFEKTLLDNDTQAYVWYRKGGAIMYALQDLIGEDNLNSAFRKYIDEAAFRPKAPYTTSTEWYSYIEEVTPDSLQYYIEDSFEKITLYTNKVTKANYKKLADDTYEVTLEVESNKNYYGGNGETLGEGKTPNLLDIGIFAADEENEKGLEVKKPLVLEKKWVAPGKSSYTFITKEMPIKAGIDPYNKMIDRIPDDNMVDVEESEE
ncbi:ABC transporter permease/M1 family aminopeptidase [Spongiimicrobium salis]|uniref:ABC transporter permease/M1 family aminopeptidase n=1 Tax=Spongiimicrobium salis TaxID=1667022 RepID=UPI00374CC625